MYCTKCGHRNPADARFCARCGTALQDETTVGYSAHEAEEDVGAEEALAVEELARGQALLVVRRGPNAGSRYLIDQDLTTAGRSPDSDIFLDDITVSRRHAEIRRREGRFVIRDVGSLNGTYVNRERVEETALTSGDELQIGKFRLTFLAGG